jgi:hypothetical protein
MLKFETKNIKFVFDSFVTIVSVELEMNIFCL